MPDPPGAAADDRDLRAARRALVLFVLGVAAALVGVIAVLSGLLDDDSDESTVATPDPEEVSVLGPDPGEPAVPYVEARRAQLTEAEGRRAAVVSFGTYLPEVEAARHLDASLEVVGLLFALPAGEPRLAESVSDDRAAVVADAESQLQEITGLVDTVDDPEFAEFYRSEMIRYRELLDGADREDVVFGAVVIGRAGDLRALAERAGVRLVDVGHSAALARDAEISGLRPEETVTTGEPRFRP